MVGFDSHVYVTSLFVCGQEEKASSSIFAGTRGELLFEGDDALQRR